MPTTYLEAIREGLWEEMERDPNVFLIGDDAKEALVSRLSLQAVGYDDAVALGRRFLETVQVIR